MIKIERIKKNCPICGTEFEDKISGDRVTCSYKCGRKSSGKKMKGNKHAQGNKPWNKGLTKETDKRLMSISKKSSEQMHREYKSGIRDRFEITKKAHEAVKKYGQPKLRGKPGPMLGRTKANGLFAEHSGFQKGKDNFVNKHPEKHPNYIMAQKGHRTQPEKVMEELLKKNKINYIYNKKIGTYWVDFLLPEKNIIIEVDGHHWHQKENKKRDDFLISKGYKVLHWEVKKYSRFILQRNADEFFKKIK